MNLRCRQEDGDIVLMIDLDLIKDNSLPPHLRERQRPHIPMTTGTEF